MSWIIAIDIGGTFTDAVALGSDGRVEVAKVPSTPDDPARALAEAVAELGEHEVPLSQVSALFHGTTVATNAVITGKLARVALVVTEGYRDILSFRSGGRPQLYNLAQPRPPELVRRRDRLEARERLAWNGEVVEELTNEEIDRLKDELADRNPQAIAVCFLFSYMNDTHEKKLGDALGRRFPGVSITLSSEIVREFREYPRTATTALNAALRPVVGSYLLRAEASVRETGLRAPFLIMQSNGGSVPAARADREAHRLLVSGPTAGVAGAIALGARSGLDRLISMDMGGTSLDVCLVKDGVPPVTSRAEVDSHPVLAPSVDIVTVGAGGGSIASIDAAGRLRVGPASAGAVPGPAAYGRGGTDATITDAHLVLGTLTANTPLAGRISLDRDASLKAIGCLAEKLQLAVEETAAGVVAVALAHMVRALRRVSIERGVDPGEYTLVAFGGAGPLHAAQLLREMRLQAVVVPRHPGLFSASGLVAADMRIDESQTVLRVAAGDVFRNVATWYAQAKARLIAQLLSDGIARNRMRLVAAIDCRYLGQGFELTIPIRGLTVESIAGLPKDFHAIHQQTYGHAAPDEQIELVTLRLSAFGALTPHEAAGVRRGGRQPIADACLGVRNMRLPGQSRRLRVPIFSRDLLRARNAVSGPAVVEEMDSTTIVLPRQRMTVDDFGSLWIREKASEEASR